MAEGSYQTYIYLLLGVRVRPSHHGRRARVRRHQEPVDEELRDQVVHRQEVLRVAQDHLGQNRRLPPSFCHQELGSADSLRTSDGDQVPWLKTPYQLVKNPAG